MKCFQPVALMVVCCKLQKQFMAQQYSNYCGSCAFQVRVEAPRDPNRLLKGTTAHISRVEAAREEERKPRDSAFILHSNKRSVPNWRAGVHG